MKLLTILLLATTVAAQSLLLKPRKWQLDPQTFMAGVVPLSRDGGLAFTFPESATPDPFAERARVGYLLHPQGWPLTGTTITATFRLVVIGTPTFNDRFDPGPCTAPAAVRFYVQSGALYTGDENSRWWSNPSAVMLAGALDGSLMTLTAALTPSAWTNLFGHRGDSSGAATDGFWGTLANPTWVGLTFGSLCFFGHGVSVTGGSVEFVLTDYRVD